MLVNVNGDNASMTHNRELFKQRGEHNVIVEAIAGVVSIAGCAAGIATADILVTLLIRYFGKNRTQHT